MRGAGSDLDSRLGPDRLGHLGARKHWLFGPCLAGLAVVCWMIKQGLRKPRKPRRSGRWGV
jgi:hypothetical protein